MNNLKNIALLLILTIFTSCASTAIFPTSSFTPAADISTTRIADKNGNFRISIIAKNLASPDRLNPPQRVYVVWIVTHNEGTKNIGQLTNKNAQTAKLETVTPFAFSEVFITAEGQGDISYPNGVEISRARFNK
jgi:hypothetical protein